MDYAILLFFQHCSLPSVIEVADDLNGPLFKYEIKVVIAYTENQSECDPRVQILDGKMNVFGLLLHNQLFIALLKHSRQDDSLDVGND